MGEGGQGGGRNSWNPRWVMNDCMLGDRAWTTRFGRRRLQENKTTL